MNTLSPFAHRRNPDKSIDSICTVCFQTIASEDLEGKLIAHERSHTCDPYWQSRFDYRESAFAPSPQPVCHSLLRPDSATRSILR
jgi:hypothetical protein